MLFWSTGLLGGGLWSLRARCRGEFLHCLLAASPPLLNFGVEYDYSQLATHSLWQKQLVRCIHLDVDGGAHCLIVECYLQVHSTIQRERLLVISPWDFIRLLEMMFPETCNSGNFLEEFPADNGDVGSCINEAVGRHTLYLDLNTLTVTPSVLHTDSTSVGFFLIIRV